VESAGVEPASKPVAKVLSTCLALLCFFDLKPVEGKPTLNLSF
jgi:hypothetical protein